MNYSCPHCKKELRWKMISVRPLPGVVLDPKPYGATLYCPLCGGALKLNQHKYERKFLIAAIFVGVFTSLLVNQLHSIWFGVAGLFVICIIASAYAWFMWKYLVAWNRYVPY
jgi:uncharacterized protein YbaR (Trm112 family)